jgi:hypothetical protein
MDVPRLGCLGVKYGNSVTRGNRDSLGRASPRSLRLRQIAADRDSVSYARF